MTMRFLSCLILLSGASIVAHSQDFYRDSNGVTIKCENASPYDTGVVDGKVYVAVNNDSIRVIRDKGVTALSAVCTSSVGDMSFLFSQMPDFNDDISSWDVSQVIDMSSMFTATTDFNADISLWDVSKVAEMSNMFAYVKTIPDISSWDVSSVSEVVGMFSNSKILVDLSNWNFPAVTNMSRMFWASSNTSSAKIDEWDVSAVTDMSNMFANARSIADIGNWNVKAVTSMKGMFNSSEFNEDISNWDVSSVSDMSNMFYWADRFNQDIGIWDVTNVTDMAGMFFYAGSFAQNLSSWCVARIGSSPFDFADESFLDLTDHQPNWGCSVAPEAHFSSSTTSGTAPILIGFDASASSDSNGDALTYTWDFGDGSALWETSSSFATHQFDSSGTFTVTLTVSDGSLESTYSVEVTIASGVGTESAEIPTEFKLYPAYPNPFNPSTTINFDVPDNSPVTITVIDILGKRVASLVQNRSFPTGHYAVSFESQDLPSGTYLVVLRTKSLVQQQTVVLVK